MNSKINKIIESNMENCDVKFQDIENKIVLNSSYKKTNNKLLFALAFSLLAIFCVSIPIVAISISNSIGANTPSVEISTSDSSNSSNSNYKANL